MLFVEQSSRFLFSLREEFIIFFLQLSTWIGGGPCAAGFGLGHWGLPHGPTLPFGDFQAPHGAFNSRLLTVIQTLLSVIIQPFSNGIIQPTYDGAHYKLKHLRTLSSVTIQPVSKGITHSNRGFPVIFGG